MTVEKGKGDAAGCDGKTRTADQITLEVEPLRENAAFLQHLPAYRGKEVTTDVIDGSSSLVWNEAARRFRAPKVVMACNDHRAESTLPRMCVPQGSETALL